MGTTAINTVDVRSGAGTARTMRPITATEQQAAQALHLCGSAVASVAPEARPGSAAVHSRAQADTFGPIADRLRVIGNGIAVDRYDVHLAPDEPRHLGFVGRISPEKGIDDVFAIAAASGVPVRAWGLMQDRSCWDAAAARHPTTSRRPSAAAPGC